MRYNNQTYELVGSLSGTLIPGNASAGQAGNPPIRRKPMAWRPASLTPAFLILVAGIAAYWTESWILVWIAILPAFWLVKTAPEKAIELLILTTPCFPIIRLSEDMLNAQTVSTKGLFFSIDDPVIAALLIVWLWEIPSRGKKARFFPSALIWLLITYFCVGMLNLTRLDLNQSVLSFLYLLKWLEYAALIFVIPQLLRPEQARNLAGSIKGSVAVGLTMATLFAIYEFVQALQTGSYTSVARFPRSSSFFGTLNPARFGASEDPVNFGVYAMMAGAILLAMAANRGSTKNWIGTGLSVISILLSTSRAPVLAGVVAWIKIQRIRSSRLLLGLAASLLLFLISVAIIPGIWAAIDERFSAMADWSGGVESSAMDRLTIALNSPVFDIDQYWAAGHGFSSYRFIATEHLAGLTKGTSRSLYNFLLTAWYDAGPIGLFLWLLLFLQLNRKLDTIAKTARDQNTRSLAIGVRGALWGLAVASLFGEVPYHWRLNGFISALIGTCLAAGSAAGRVPSFWVGRRTEA